MLIIYYILVNTSILVTYTIILKMFFIIIMQRGITVTIVFDITM